MEDEMHPPNRTAATAKRLANSAEADLADVPTLRQLPITDTARRDADWRVALAMAVEGRVNMIELGLLKKAPAIGVRLQDVMGFGGMSTPLVQLFSTSRFTVYHIAFGNDELTPNAREGQGQNREQHQEGEAPGGHGKPQHGPVDNSTFASTTEHTCDDLKQWKHFEHHVQRCATRRNLVRREMLQPNLPSGRGNARNGTKQSCRGINPLDLG